MSYREYQAREYHKDGTSHLLPIYRQRKRMEDMVHHALSNTLVEKIEIREIDVVNGEIIRNEIVDVYSR